MNNYLGGDMKRVAIYGGTFNPIHNGHIIALQALKDSNLFHKILLIPAGYSPFKMESTETMHHRFNMVELVLKQLVFAKISRIEASNDNPSYTYKSLTALQRIEPDTKFYWSIGYDNLSSIQSWKHADKLLREFGLVVLNRGGYDPGHALESIKNIKETYDTEILEVTMPDIQISSSDIRERIKEGKSIYGYCPLEVNDYIKKHNLYKENLNEGL